MNYIKRLQQENAEQAATIAGYAAMIQDLKIYLGSAKFSSDPTVQVGDILDRTTLMRLHECIDSNVE